MDNEQILNRFKELIKEGDNLIESIPRDRYGLTNYVEDKYVPEYQQWMSSVANLLNIVYPYNKYYLDECDRLITDKLLKSGVNSYIVQYNWV